MTRYRIPAAPHRAETVVARSRFLTLLAHAPSAADAHAVVAAARAEFPDATHHCWAFVAGPPGSTAAIGMSDDGEPHGTAGRPMLTALLHAGVGEIVAVVVRWYGGTKLGTGGLARAYAGGVADALATLPTVERVARTVLRITLGHGDAAALRARLAAHEARVIDEAWGADATLAVELPVSGAADFAAMVRDLSRGTAVVDEADRPRAATGEAG